MRPARPPAGFSNKTFAGFIAAVTVVVLARLLIAFPLLDPPWRPAIITGYIAILSLLALIVLRGLAHRWLGWLALIAAMLHTGLLLWLEPPVRARYFQLNAPTHILSAWLAAGLLLVVWVTALTWIRRRYHWRFKPFRRWHIVLATLTLLLSAYHSLPRSVVLEHPALHELAGVSPWPAMNTQTQRLAVQFDHADHGKIQCTQCHHNFIDGSGGGSCFLCHQSDPRLAARMELDFHALCQDCHRSERKAGHTGGPVQQCSACHPRTAITTAAH